MKKSKTVLNQIETHPFAPFIPAEAMVLIIGSFPGRDIIQKNLEKDDWFPGTKRNQFWEIISGVYNVELETSLAKKEFFIKKGIAIADIILQARRLKEINSDDSLEIIAYNEKVLQKNLANNSFDNILFTSMQRNIF